MAKLVTIKAINNEISKRGFVDIELPENRGIDIPKVVRVLHINKNPNCKAAMYNLKTDNHNISVMGHQINELKIV